MKWIFIAFISLAFNINAQENKPWEIGCDTLGTQLDMNLCSHESYLIADSVLQEIYKVLISRKSQILDRMLAMEEKEQNQSIIQSLKVQITSLKSMKEHFMAYRESQIKLVGLQYEGGSMRPLVENNTALRLTVEHIQILYDTLEEL